MSEGVNLPPQFLVRPDLAMRVGFPVDGREPAAHLFFRRYDGNGFFFGGTFKTSREPLAGGMVALQLREMV